MLFFSSKISKNPDPSYKMDLNFKDCFGMEKKNTVHAKFQKTDLDIWVIIEKGKPCFIAK